MADGSVEKEEQVIIKATSGLNKKVQGKIVCGVPRTLEENSIILLPHCHFEGLIRILGKVKGLIFNWGSPYDHLGIIAREMNIPAMYNAYNAIDLLKDGDIVELDGVNGTITKLNAIK
jgi:pyruvate,water dikinase